MSGKSKPGSLSIAQSQTGDGCFFAQGMPFAGLEEVCSRRRRLNKVVGQDLKPYPECDSCTTQPQPTTASSAYPLSSSSLLLHKAGAANGRPGPSSANKLKHLAMIAAAVTISALWITAIIALYQAGSPSPSLFSSLAGQRMQGDDHVSGKK